MNVRCVCRFLGLAAASLALVAPALCAAQPAWPTRPIRLVVPFVAGGGADVTARLIAARLQAQLGQQVVVDNKPGGNTLIGARDLIKAAPDGYTLMWSIDQTFVLNPSLYNRLPYDPRRDFTPISLVITSPNAVIARAGAPGAPGALDDVHALVQRAKAEPGRTNIGAAAILSQMALEEFKRSAGIEATRVPYKGSAEVAQATIAGDIDAAFDGIAPYVQFVQSGRAKILAFTSLKRFSGRPDVPTLDELGYKGVDFSVWFGIVGPAGLPPEIVRRVSEGVDQALREPEVVQKLLLFGFEPAAETSPQALGRRIDSDITRYDPVIRRLGFKLD